MSKDPGPAVDADGGAGRSRRWFGAISASLSLLGILAGVALATAPLWRTGTGVTPASAWLSLPETTTLERIGFGSCLHQKMPMPIWSAVRDAKPQLFLMMGDNVYGDVTDASMKELREAYATLMQNADFAKARAVLPFLATWDDHDYGRNDASGNFPHKAAAARLFYDFWQTRPAPGIAAGVYSARIYGPPGRRVQIILLDTRWFRSEFKQRSPVERQLDRAGGTFVPDTLPGKTMLGEAQWAWLERQLQVPAELRFVVSSIQLLAEAHGWERWGHLPRERDRFFELLARTRTKGVVLLSGDRHRAAIYRKADGLGHPLYEVTSSSLNRPYPAAEPPDPGRLGDMYGAANYGLVTIDWAARKLQLALRGQTGVDVQTLSLTFAELGVSG